VTRISITRVSAVAAATLALVGSLALGAAGPWPAAMQALARAGGVADYVDSGPRLVPPPAPTSSVPEGQPGDGSNGTSRTDLEGDDVSPALATYGIDHDGNLFEVHSPHTEVPRLGGPTI
jgi:hypothetical protein